MGKLSIKNQEAIKDLARDHYSIKYIADTLKISESTVRSFLEKLKRYHAVSKLLKEGKSYEKIAEILNVSIATIHRDVHNIRYNDNIRKVKKMLSEGKNIIDIEIETGIPSTVILYHKRLMKEGHQ